MPRQHLAPAQLASDVTGERGKGRVGGYIQRRESAVRAGRHERERRGGRRGEKRERREEGGERRREKRGGCEMRQRSDGERDTRIPSSTTHTRCRTTIKNSHSSPVQTPSKHRQNTVWMLSTTSTKPSSRYPRAVINNFDPIRAFQSLWSG